MGLVYRPDDPRANENGMIDASLAAPRVQTFGVAPYVISDIMSPTRHMATGRMHTSKSEFRKDTKASGCVEVGNDTSITKPRTPVQLDRRKRREDIQRAVQTVRDATPRKRRRKRSS